MSGKRNRYSSSFKAKVALDAIRGELTVAELSAKHGVHPTMIHAWKKQAVDGMASSFDRSSPSPDAKGANTIEVEKLHAKIGELVVERDFLRTEIVKKMTQ